MKATKELRKRWNARRDDLKELLEAPGHVTPELGLLHEYGVELQFFKAGVYPQQEDDAVFYWLQCEELPQEAIRFYRSGKIEFVVSWWDKTLFLDLSKDEVTRGVKNYFSGDVPEAPWF
ncbi:MAG: hypothetical protein JRH08_11585 [Deltaproteobacteria bacterium]|nr:hypothetical protein [Deltaproteobacteria bacterium]